MHKQWLHWGGQQEEMENITREQVAWLNQLPAMALVKDRLLIHGDNLSYVNYGQTVSQVNEYFQQLMRSDDIDQWQRTLIDFSVRGAFNLRISGPKQASLILKMYGGSELIHGHTPIPYTLDVEPNAVIEARNYANGLCWNVDGGIYLGSPGFVYSYD